MFRNSESGFTLLEVLIAMAVLVFISFAIYQATVETYKLRDTLAKEGDFYNGIHLASVLLQRDISMIFSPTLGLPSPSPSSAPGAGGAPPPMQPAFVSANDDLNRTFPFWGPAANQSGLRPSHFIGTQDKLSFVSVSNIRIYKDSPESEFAKITYELKRDEKDKTNPDLMVLIKTENPNAFAMEETRDAPIRTYEILHGIKKLTYTYYQWEGNTWKSSRSWDSDKEETKNQYPDMIELKMEVAGPRNQIFDGVFKIRPEIPLNGLNPSS